jgi:protein tyrosine phosphatase (PTP) superfamily phosphohydrolase (DUF442 family)
VHGRIRINEQMTTGRQPTEEDPEQLAREGFERVVNLCLPHEEDQPLSPDYEGIKVRARHAVPTYPDLDARLKGGTG